MTRSPAPPDPLDTLRAAQDALDATEQARTQAVHDRDAAIRTARAEGIPASTIADALGVDRAIVYRALKRK